MMAIAERVNRRVLGFLDLWDKGTLLLFLFGGACAVVSAVLHFTYLRPVLGNSFEAALLACLFEAGRVTLLVFTGLTYCVNRPVTGALGKFFFSFAAVLSVISFTMHATLIFRSGLRPMSFQEFFTGGSLMMLVLTAVMEVCLFAGFWLPIALHASEIGSILEKRRAENEAVIGYIYELRAQRLREGRVDLAAANFFVRLKTLFQSKKDQLDHEPNQG
jgi:hypothetical protein